MPGNRCFSIYKKSENTTPFWKSFCKIIHNFVTSKIVQPSVMLNNTRTYSDIWQNCLDQIKARTSAEEFEKWFQPIVPLEFDGTTLRLRVPNESYVRQIEKNYIPFLKPIISQLYGQQTRLHYAVPRTTVQAVPVAADSDTPAISRLLT